MNEMSFFALDGSTCPCGAIIRELDFGSTDWPGLYFTSDLKVSKDLRYQFQDERLITFIE